MIVDCEFVLIVAFDSAREWLCGCSSRLGWSELLRLELLSLPVPEREDVSLSAKNPSLFEELNPSGLSELSTEVEGRTDLFESGSLIVLRNRVVAGVWRGVASLEVRLRGSVPSSGDDDLLLLMSLWLWSCDLLGP